MPAAPHALDELRKTVVAHETRRRRAVRHVRLADHRPPAMSKEAHVDIRLTEIAAGIHQLTTYLPEMDFSLNQFVVAADEPLLFHTGMRWMFPSVAATVSRLMPARSRAVDRVRPHRGRRVRIDERVVGRGTAVDGGPGHDRLHGVDR